MIFRSYALQYIAPIFIINMKKNILLCSQCNIKESWCIHIYETVDIKNVENIIRIKSYEFFMVIHSIIFINVKMNIDYLLAKVVLTKVVVHEIKNPWNGTYMQ